MLQRSPRALALWAAAAGLAIVTGSVVAGDLAALHRRARALGPEEPVVIARTTLSLGATVTAADVTTRRVHTSQVPAGVLRNVDDAVGRVVQVPVVRDGYVHAAHLAPRRRDGLAGALPVGTRAVRVPVEGGLQPPPGSAVDVYAPLAAPLGAGAEVLGTGRAGNPGAVVVASGAVVLDAGPDAVTLLVDEIEATALAGASTLGALVLALVPPEDARVPVGLTRR